MGDDLESRIFQAPTAPCSHAAKADVGTGGADRLKVYGFGLPQYLGPLATGVTRPPGTLNPKP